HPRPTVLSRGRWGAAISGLVNADEHHPGATAQDSGVRGLIVERPSLRDPACDRAVEPTSAFLAGDTALPSAAREERHEQTDRRQRHGPEQHPNPCPCGARGRLPGCCRCTWLGAPPLRPP